MLDRMLDIQPNVSLKPYNTFSFDYAAEFFAVAESIEDLISHVKYANDNQLKVTVIGGGSNLLIQGNIKGLVILNRILGRSYFDVTPDAALDVPVQSPTAEFGAGEVWDDCVQDSVSKGWGGIENLGLIPGTCGAAPVQNIGAYGVEIKDVLCHVEALNCQTYQLERIEVSECGFSYRDSYFKGKWSSKYIITKICLKLSRKAPLILTYGGLSNKVDPDASYLKVYEAVCEVRRSKLPDPKELPNSGSFFKNPIVTDAEHKRLRLLFSDLVSYKVEGGWKLAAGWLNEKAGWKGKRVGRVGVYEKQALVLVNHGDSKAMHLQALEASIIESVEVMFGVTLEREPVLLGESA